MKTILFQGDSITDGMNSWENQKTTLGLGYTTLIGSELSLDYPGEYQFYNRGICGNRIVDLYARIKSDMINLKPDVLSILVGGNDVWHEFMFGNGVAAEKFFDIYSMLIEEVQAALPDTRIMLMEPFILKGDGTRERWEEFRSEVELRAKKVRELAEKYHLVFIPLQEQFDEAEKSMPAEYWLSDGVHPTMAGHEMIKRAWLQAFRELEDALCQNKVRGMVD